MYIGCFKQFRKKSVDNEVFIFIYAKRNVKRSIWSELWTWDWLTQTYRNYKTVITVAFSEVYFVVTVW